MTTELQFVRANRETLESEIRNALQLVTAIRERCRSYAVPEEESLMCDMLEIADGLQARLDKVLDQLREGS